ncbi:4'-phosphopantetheinyl transferase superfamily protein [Anderseniella sp. Alg231-50]|uniref:4'-phosphopantetheinyl transferase superfamily protein n=1 Tax=Anderseniella sp. Alg231-50 TaxID=1922226 RepID=UPI000D556A1C
MTTDMDDTGWSVAYARPCDVLQRLGTDALGQEEHAWAARLSSMARHQHFIAGRALLRHRLSAETEDTVQPADWEFVSGDCGKPAVRPDMPDIRFSISHADGLVAVATSLTAEVGVDLERVSGTQDTDPALDQLTAREKAWLQRHGDDETWQAFLELWTAKEAVSKAAGLGCGVDFRDIEINVPARRASCPDSLLKDGDHMKLDLQTIRVHDASYCLSVASM